MNQDVMVVQVRQFLALYPLDEWWPGTNPQYKPLAAATTSGIYALCRIACPALGDARDALVAGVVRAAGFRLVPEDGGYRVDRKSSTPAPGSGDDPGGNCRIHAASALASA